MILISKDNINEAQEDWPLIGSLPEKTEEYIQDREGPTRIKIIGNNHSGQEMAAESRLSDRHNTPSVIILQNTVPKRKNKQDNISINVIITATMLSTITECLIK